MKRISLYPFALSALLCLAGCADEDSFGPSSVRGDNSLLAVIEGQETDVVSRTAVDDAGRVTWIATDALGVYAAHTENALFSSTGSGASVVFKGNLSPADDAAEWAYYPYDANAVVNGQTLSFTLPDEYTYTGNSHAPMLAVKGSEGNFEFKHLCGLLRITLGGGMPADADRFVITSVGDDAPALSGVATVSDVMATDATLALPKEGGRTITYTLGALSSAEELQHFFVPLPVGSYPKLQVAFYLKDKSEPEFTRTLSGLQVRRAVMTCMPILDWRTGEQFVLNENTIEITEALAKHVSVSPENNTTLLYKATAADDVPNVGNVVWSRVSDDFPYGFLGKVTKVTANGDGSYTVETGVASLSEAFDELCIEETVELTPEGTPSLQSRGLEAGYLENGKFSTSVELEIKEEPKESPFYVSGKAGIGAEVTASIYLSKNKVDNTFFKVEADAIQKGEIGMHIQYDDENEILKKKLAEIRFMNIPLGGGLIQLTPTMAPYFHIKAKGEINNKLNFSSKTKCIYHGQYIDGRGWTAKKEEQPSASKDTPWSLGGSLDFSGELTVGLSNKFSLKLYNRDDMSVYIEPEIGAKLKGEISINDTNSTSLEQILKDAKLETYFYMGGSIGFNASLITPGDFEEKLTIEAVKFCKREIPLFRSMNNLSAQVEQAEEITAEVSTEANGEQLIKEAQVSIALADNTTGEIIETSEPVGCNAATEKEDPVEEKIPVETTFGNIKEGVEYKSYPIIQSPILEELVPEGKVELKSLEATFKASGSLRDQLIQMYKDTQGDNWTNNENWCSNKPIDEWYGIYKIEKEDHSIMYSIDLPYNNLNGQIHLSDTSICKMILVGNQVNSLNMNGCKNLDGIEAYSVPIKTLRVAGCKKLSNVSYNENDVVTLDISNSNFMLSDHFYSTHNSLRNFIAQGRTDFTSLLFPFVQLDTLDLSGCINLTDFSIINAGKFINLRYLDLSQCDALPEGFLNRMLVNNTSLEYLNISNCTNPKGLAYNTPDPYVVFGTSVPNTIREINARNCLSLVKLDAPFGYENLSKVDVTGCSNLLELNIGGPQLTLLDLTGCSSLSNLTCSSSNITSLDLSPAAKTLTSLVCTYNLLMSFLDVSKCANLESLSCTGTPLNNLDIASCTKLQNLECSDVGLMSLELEACSPSLMCLNCAGNKLSYLDLTSCTNLQILSCGENQLTTLDVSECPDLNRIECKENQIREFKYSSLKKMECFYCEKNQMAELDLSNCTSLSLFDCTGNPIQSLNLSGCASLSYFRVDFIEGLNLNLSGCVNIDEQSIRYMLTTPIKSLNVSNHTGLKELSVNACKITDLNFSGCTNLATLSCSGLSNPIILGEITSLNVSGCTNLDRLSCDKNKIHTLNFNGCTNLSYLYCGNNDLHSIDISQCTKLNYLDCSENPNLTNLILMNQPTGLFFIACYGTKIKQELPNWSIEGWLYDERYEYYEDFVDGQLVTKYTDKGYGWWYPGEPESGAHRR